MNKDFKIMIGALLVTFAIIVGLASLMGGKKTDEDVEVASAKIEGVESNPENYDLGDVPINGGKVMREYSVKNTTDNTLKLKRVATSCMCTQAWVKYKDQESRKFGMEGHGDKNPPINLEVPAGGTVIVLAEFDPAAHGPQGVGPFDRIVWLTFSDPAGIKELRFSGTVVK